MYAMMCPPTSIMTPTDSHRGKDPVNNAYKGSKIIVWVRKLPNGNLTRANGRKQLINRYRVVVVEGVILQIKYWWILSYRLHRPIRLYLL